MNANPLIPPYSLDNPRGRVLCVDDEPNILRALFWLLRKDFEVVTTESAREALGLLLTGEFDVIISDNRMPEMSGVEFLSQVKAMAPRAMRILLTGYSDMHSVIQSVNESEIFRFIAKPWDVIELPQIVAQAAEIARRQANHIAVAAEQHPEICGLRLPKMLVLDEDEATHSVVEMSAGDLAQIIHVTSPVDAFKILEDEEVGIILSERSLGTMDVTHLLCQLKRKHPQIVSMVVTASEDSNLICRMINQGQIYRFLPKPLKAGNLRLALKSAIAKRAELLETPSLADRHQVSAMSADETKRFQQTLTAKIGGASAHSTELKPRSSGIMSKLFRRLFGG